MKEFKFDEDLIIEVDEERLDNMELLDLLVEMDEGHPERVGKVFSLLFGSETKKKIYDYYRNDKGIVPASKIMEKLQEFFLNFGKQAKN